MTPRASQTVPFGCTWKWLRHGRGIKVIKGDKVFLLIFLVAIFPPAGILIFLWWLLMGARQSQVKRGILAALIAWAAIGFWWIGQVHT
jgi:hypothetical protein